VSPSCSSHKLLTGVVSGGSEVKEVLAEQLLLMEAWNYLESLRKEGSE